MLYPVPISSIYDVEENQTCHIRGEPVPLNVHLKDVPCPPIPMYICSAREKLQPQNGHPEKKNEIRKIRNGARVKEEEIEQKKKKRSERKKGKNSLVQFTFSLKP